jgi:bifunctional UDP-N-acetylglucosamine pyrophosphorylase/glucosamine-1-phosphate N-acetyltransferase
MTSTFRAIVLAAGQGTRMKSSLPKVLHPVAGRPMIHHPVRAALDAGAAEVIVVVGHGRDAVIASLAKAFGDRVRTAVQEEQKGTGHAVACALPALPAGDDPVLVFYGDAPLIESSTLAALVAARADAPMAMVTATLDDATGYGRVLRDGAGNVTGIREQKDCSADERAIREFNPGVYIFHTGFLRGALPRLSTNNAQHELYLTDTVALGAAEGGVRTTEADPGTLVGVNDRAQLAEVEAVMHARIANRWRRSGVTVRATAVIDDTVEVAPDAVIEHGAVLRGATRVGAGAKIDVGCVLDDAVVAAGTIVKPYSVLSSSTVGERAQIGPFSHLRPGSDIHDEAHIGNFVETKATIVRRGAKANHLAYLGDGDIGEGANVGAGTIFCNYDGFQKHRTIIGKGAFIGSDSQLVAPLTIGDGAYVATGTTVTKDVPADALAIGRTPQQNKEGYAARLRGRLEAAAKAAKAAKGAT